MLDNYICALDIGSSKIAACVARLNRKRVIDIFFESLPSRGVKRGVIINSLELTDALGKAVKNLKLKSGIKIKFVHTNICGPDIATKHSRAIIPLTERGNKVITLSDIEKVNEQARILGSSLEEEIIHSIPFGYTIDGRDNISEPLGLYSHRLEADLYLVCAKLSYVQSLSRAVNQAGYEMKSLSFSGIATAYALFNAGLERGADIVCDIGSDITELLIFKDARLKDIKVLPLGGDDLTFGLSDTLRIPFGLAEEIKRGYGIIGDCSQIKENKEVLVKKDNAYKPIKQKTVCEIITSKAESICKEIKDALGKNIDSGRINNFLVAGRTVLSEGFLEALEAALGIPVKLGKISDPQIVPWVNKKNELSGHGYLDYLTSLGMVCKALKGNQPQITYVKPPEQRLILKAINKLKEIYQEYF